MVVLIASVNRLRISAGGQCTAMNEHGDSSEDGTEREQVLHVNSSGRLRFGTSRFSVSDMLHEVFLWLMKQSKGKNIKADKVLLASPVLDGNSVFHPFHLQVHLT